MGSIPVTVFLFLAVASSVQAGLSDQTFTWVDLSTGVAATVAVCVLMVGICFVVYEFKFRDYFSEVRVNGRPYALDLCESDVGLPDPPSTIEAKSSSDVEKVDVHDIDPPMEVAFVNGDQ